MTNQEAFELVGNLRKVQEVLKCWSKDKFKGILEKIKKVKEEISRREKELNRGDELK